MPFNRNLFFPPQIIRNLVYLNGDIALNKPLHFFFDNKCFLGEGLLHLTSTFASYNVLGEMLLSCLHFIRHIRFEHLI